MRAIIKGGRGYQNARRVYQVLDAAVARLGLSSIVIDGAMGVSYFAEGWAAARKIEAIVVRADWGRHRDAGERRNRDMVANYSADALMAFPGDDDTDDAIAVAEKAGLRVIRIDPDQRHTQPQEGLLI